MSTDVMRTLEEDIEHLVPVIQDLFATVLENRLGEGVVGITAICRDLKLHRKLAWQVRSAAYAPDPFQAVAFIPTRAGIEALAGALAEAPPGIAERLTDAFRRFEEMVRTHAGDRAHFEKLVESNPANSRSETEAKWRERAFLGNSFIWGVQARTQHSLSILNASESRADWLDLVQVRSLIGLQRVRPNTRWIVSQSIVLSGTDDGPGDVLRERVPLDPEGAGQMGGVPVIREFCSQPPPRLVRRPEGLGLTNDELLPGPVGSTGQQTVVTGEVVRNLAPAYRVEEGERALFGVICRTPSEAFVYDHFVHKDLFPDVARELCIFSELNSPVTQDDSDLLPVSETIQELGRGMNAARTPDIPGYMGLLEWVFARLGWDPRDFGLYRVRLAYPPMPSTVVIRHDLPAPRGGGLSARTQSGRPGGHR